MYILLSIDIRESKLDFFPNFRSLKTNISQRWRYLFYKSTCTWVYKEICKWSWNVSTWIITYGVYETERRAFTLHLETEWQNGLQDLAECSGVPWERVIVIDVGNNMMVVLQTYRIKKKIWNINIFRVFDIYVYACIYNIYKNSTE